MPDGLAAVLLATLLTAVLPPLGLGLKPGGTHWCPLADTCLPSCAPSPCLQRDGCPKIINLGSAKTDLFYERKKYSFKKN
jgi:hypothetical protein